MFKLVVLSVVAAVAVAEPNVIAPLWGASWTGAVAAPLAAPLAVAAPIGAPNYRGPLSLAPGQPANILAADGRPLDTLDVNVDRAVHYTAKALTGGHLLKKRSIVAAPVVAAPLAWNGVAAARVIAPAPVAVAPVVAVGWGPAASWGPVGTWASTARWGHGW